jgi:hypothetical protein
MGGSFTTFYYQRNKIIIYFFWREVHAVPESEVGYG